MRPPALVFGCSRQVHGGEVVFLARPKGHGIVVVSPLATDTRGSSSRTNCGISLR